jgi:hypothetical protein
MFANNGKSNRPPINPKINEAIILNNTNIQYSFLLARPLKVA